MTEENLKEYFAEQEKVSDALQNLRAVVTVEAYPDLKANQNYMALQEQLESCENDIANTRRLWQVAVNEYNISVRKFPNNIFASIFGFEEALYFKADSGSDKAPKVKDLLNE